jgi:plastocyanin
MKRERVILWLVGLMLISCCARPERAVRTLPPETGERRLTMKASNYNFEPAVIQIKGAGPLLISVENVSNTEHNITVKDPQGRILTSVDLPPNKTQTVSLDLSQTGGYEFYCDKPFHPTLGMKGRIEVAQ